MADASVSSLNFWDIVEGRAAAPPAAELLGWSFAGFDQDTGTLRSRFDVRPAFLNPAGFVQGGIIAAMLDEAMGPVASAVAGGGLLAMTLEMKVSYLRGVKSGPILGYGRIVQRGRDIIFLEGWLTDAEDRVIARASATSKAVTAP